MALTLFASNNLLQLSGRQMRLKKRSQDPDITI